MSSARPRRCLVQALVISLLASGAGFAGVDVIINELDSDTAGTDALEFIELYDGGTGNSSLDGLVVVFYNGSNDLSYTAIDLDGHSTDNSGYFVLGNAAVSGVDLIFAGNLLQNGQDAAALYLANGADFPNNTPVTVANLVDAIVYDTADADDPGLLVLLNASQPQVDENSGGAGDTHSNQRCPNGSGGARNTSTYLAALPTPGQANLCPGGLTLSIGDVTEVEGDAGTTSFEFTVSLSAAAGPGGVTATCATQDGSATGGNPTGPGDDYLSFASAPISIPEGETSVPVTVTVEGDLDIEPTETFFVNVSDIVGAGAGDTQGLGTILNDEITPIHDVQGPGASSPVAGGSVTIRGIVTAVKSNGFFVQEELADHDADPATSEGIFVFTSSAPPGGIGVGDDVQVSGTVAEFVPSQDPLQPPLTELTSPVVIEHSSGNLLPPPVALTPTFPDPAGPHDQLERLEGMRVSVASMTVVGPTLGNTDEPDATATTTGVFYGVVTGVARPFREAGIPAPDPAPSGGGTIPPIPRFDSNPERIRVDSDALFGTAPIDVGAGATVTGIVGPLDYAFRTYTILPEPALPPTPAGGPTPVAVSNPASGEVTVAAYNLERFFDDNDDGIGEPVLTALAYGNRLGKASTAIRGYLKNPDILGVVEVENVATLADLADRISVDAIAGGQPDPEYFPYLVEGNDVGGIDVGFLVKTALVDGLEPRVEVVSVTQENDGELFVNADASTELLNDRPPLVLEAIVHHPNGAEFPLVVIVNHLRSLNNANSESPGSNGWSTAGARVRAKRQKQAESLANLVQARQVLDPDEHLVVLGDFNFFEVNDGLGHGMGVVTGSPVPDNETAVPGDGIDFVDPNLVNLQDTTAAQRYSFIFDGNAQSLDHLLVNASLVNSTSARRLEHPRVNADFPEVARNDYSPGNPRRLADHDPLVAFFAVPAFQHIFSDDFESGGVCEWASATGAPPC